MYYLVNSQEMKQYDKNTIEYYGIPSLVLMERAALSVVSEITKRFSAKQGRALIVCGAGNNGGDGFAVARLLYLLGYDAEILFPMNKEKMTPETKAQYDTAQKYRVPEISKLPKRSYSIIVDALFGIGLSRNIEGTFYELIQQLNQMHAFKIAVDISSGIAADTGKILKTAFFADLTVTFGFAKIGQLLYPGAEYTGELVVYDIGIDANSFLDKAPFGRYLEAEDLRQMLPKRRAYSNKGSYGKALIIAGSPNMAGAAYFAAKAAYYSGCGLVRILTAKENREILLTKLPEAIITTYDAQAADEESLQQMLKPCIEWADAILIGPGLGCGPAAQMLVEQISCCGAEKIVLDADALNILSLNMALLKHMAGGHLVTPHLGEMSRLSGKSIEYIKTNLLQTACNFAKEYQTACVLKDARTVTGMPDGTFFINTSGNHGMATGGSGDVLAGFITGFLAQGLTEKDASALGVYLHGMAGDFAAETKGAYSMLASDILEMLPEAIKEAGADEI